MGDIRNMVEKASQKQNTNNSANPATPQNTNRRNSNKDAFEGLLMIFGFIAAIAICFWLIFGVIFGGGSSSSSSSKSGEQRCWYCGKVIVNSQGTPIHKSGGKCDYCGKPN